MFAVWCLSHVLHFVISWMQHARLPCPSLSPTVCADHIHWVGDTINRLILYYPLLLLFSTFPSIRVFSNESVLHIKWPKHWSFSFGTSFSFSFNPSNDCSGFISFRTDWFDLLAIQGTLKSHLQHHNSKASILWCSAFFMVQPLHLYKTIALTIWTFVGKVMSLLFNTLSGIKQRGTKEPLDESERGEWKSWLKAQHSEN